MEVFAHARRAAAAGLTPLAHALVVGAVNTVSVASLRPAWRRFEQAARAPERAQAMRLRALLRANADTAFGRRYGLHAIDSPAAFRARVPRLCAEELASWVARVAAGEPGVLTTAPVRIMERTSGTTSANKLIPYTDALLDEFAAATGPWMVDLFARRPALLGTRSYWSVTPVTRRRETTCGGIPIGFEDDTQYFGPLRRWALQRVLAVPGSLARVADIETWRRATIGALLAAEDLGLISVWSPTFLTLLMRHLDDGFEAFVGALPAARARAIRRARAGAHGQLTGEILWPRLRLISCWADGGSASFIPELRRWFPRTEIQPKGLLATEGAVSFPLSGHPGAVLSVAGHFLEFLDLEQPARSPLLAHELVPGGVYAPLLTTGGGLYRYSLGDMVRCVGFYRATPLVRFVGKLDSVTDLCGEKLSEPVVAAAVDAAMSRTGITAAFALLSPVLMPVPHYRLYLETDADDAALQGTAATLEERLRQSCHYAYCRTLGQLGAVHAIRVRDGWVRYQAALVARGRRLGDIKPTRLDALGVGPAAWLDGPAAPAGPRLGEGG